jgi:hypothetical protein
MEARQRLSDNVDISRGQTKAHTYGLPRNIGKAVNHEPPAAEEVRGPESHGTQKGGKQFEVSLRDPWPADHASRKDCDRFLEIFKETYHEVLMEMGLAPESGDFSSVVMSDRDFKEMVRRMEEKLNANPEARELMANLNVDSSEGPPKEEKAEADTFRDGSRLLFEMLRRKYQDGVLAGENEPGLGLKNFYEPKTENQEPPVTEKIVEDQAPRAEKTVDPGRAAEIPAAAAAKLDKYLSEEFPRQNLDSGFPLASLVRALSSLAETFSSERGGDLAANRLDAFGNFAKAYNLAYDYLKMRSEEKGLDETEFEQQVADLNQAFDFSIKSGYERSAVLAFRQSESGNLVRSMNSPAFDRNFQVWDFNPQNMFAEAARNHCDIFINKFLETFREDGPEAAIAAAEEALMTSTAGISFKDLNTIINAAEKGGFDDLNDLRNSDLSDFMKEYLETEWLSIQATQAEWEKMRAELFEKQATLVKQLSEPKPNLSEQEKKIKHEALIEQIVANSKEMNELVIKTRQGGVWDEAELRSHLSMLAGSGRASMLGGPPVNPRA